MTLMLLTETRANLFFVSVVFVQSLLILITSVNLDLENLFAWKPGNYLAPPKFSGHPQDQTPQWGYTRPPMGVSIMQVQCKRQ